MSRSDVPASRHSAPAARRLGGGIAVAVISPLLVVAAALGVGQQSDETLDRAPSTEPISQVALICPGGGGSVVGVAQLDPGIGGAVESTPLDGAAEGVPIELDSGATGRPETGEPALAITADGDLARGLVAGRSTADRRTVAGCSTAATDQWFVGAGARADLATTLELANPDPASAVVDVEVFGDAGPIDAPGLRGIRVPGTDSVRIDLAEEIPERSDLALHVVSVQGRVLASAGTTVDPIGSGATASDWLPTVTPADDQLLIGPSTVRDAERSLLVANPGSDEIRVGLRVVDKRSEFEPTGVRETRVPPGSVRAIDLQGVPIRGIDGLRLVATGPVAASLRSQVGADLSYAAPGSPVAARTVAVVPAGDAELILAGADGAGVATVTTRDADGEELGRERVALSPDRSHLVELPARAVTVEVAVDRVTVSAALRLTGKGTALVPLAELPDQIAVPDVRPGAGQ